MNSLVLYHANCADGFCAAWLFKHAYPDAEFIPVQYGQEPPDVKGRHVFILDFSYKREVLETMLEQAQYLAVLDHHKTAQEDLKELEENQDEILGLYICFDMNKSGARLAWEYLCDDIPSCLPTPWQKVYSKENPPWLVDYIEDRDLWRWVLPGSKEVNAMLRSYPLTFEMFDRHHLRVPGVYQYSGEAILRRENQIVESHVKFARSVNFFGITGLAVNATVLSSEIAGELAEKADFGATWFVDQNDKQKWSIRSRKEGVDVSLIAKQFGGGGHFHAAGFTLDKGAHK